MKSAEFRQAEIIAAAKSRRGSVRWVAGPDDYPVLRRRDRFQRTQRRSTQSSTRRIGRRRKGRSCASSNRPSGSIHTPSKGRMLKTPPAMRRSPAGMRTQRAEGSRSHRMLRPARLGKCRSKRSSCRLSLASSLCNTVSRRFARSMVAMISAVGRADSGASATRMRGCGASDGAEGGAIVVMLVHRGQRASLPIQHHAADDADRRTVAQSCRPAALGHGVSVRAFPCGGGDFAGIGASSPPLTFDSKCGAIVPARMRGAGAQGCDTIAG